MELNEFKKAVYELAEFNGKLTKGYKNIWKSADYRGYKYKHERLRELVRIAKQNKYIVYYDARVCVVYFIFGEVQISFHTGSSAFDCESYGLPSTNIEWDGIKNAYKYSESEYLGLKKYRKEELHRRKDLLSKLEKNLNYYVIKYRSMLEQKLKKVRSSSSKSAVVSEIEHIDKMSNSSILKYIIAIYPDDSEFIKLYSELLPMYNDNYIVNFTVG